MVNLPRLRVCGVSVDCATLDESLLWADQRIRARGTDGVSAARAVFAVNPEKVMQARMDSALAASLESGGLLIPDGIGVVLALRWLHGARVARVPGSELMPELCRLAAEKEYSVFLLGGRADVNRRAAQSLRHLYPTLRIAGTHHGFFKEEESADVVDMINEADPDILFVALGSPKQELWIAQHLDLLKARVCQGIGGTLDVLAGDVRRAPAFMRLANLEWLYRILSQPSRAPRYRALPRFAFAVACQLVASHAKHSQASGERPIG
jgi:N-acetylglucosaminyldiphosphoundecaprenol N-acetyl-beta-D-mannosaminyltransferase